MLYKEEEEEKVNISYFYLLIFIKIESFYCGYNFSKRNVEKNVEETTKADVKW